MTDERERVERLVREGKVSEDEGRKLIAALDDAERREARPPPPEKAAGPVEAGGGSEAKRPGIFSRPAGWFLTGLGMILAGSAVSSLLIRRAMRTLPGDIADKHSLAKELSEAASGLENAWSWGVPFFAVGALFVVVSIVRWVVGPEKGR